MMQMFLVLNFSRGLRALKMKKIDIESYSFQYKYLPIDIYRVVLKEH